MTAAHEGRLFDSAFNVVAGFRGRFEAEAAARQLKYAGLQGATVEVAARPDPGGPMETAELRAEMQDELSASWAGATGRQARGAVFGGGAFALTGLVVGAVFGLLLGLGLVDAPVAGTMLAGAIIGAVGGAVAGLVVGGGMAPRAAREVADLDDPTPAAERDVLLVVHANEPDTAQQAARLLREDLHADRVDLVDAAGTPLPPQAGHPRPADPKDYWWREAGQG